MIFHVIIKMKIIIVLILSIFYYPPLTTQDDSGVKNQVICNIAGRIWRSTYVFNISQLPKRCDIITVAQYAFDLNDGIDTHVKESDKGIIRSLVKAKQTVYTHIGFQSTDDWYSIFDPLDTEVFQKQIFDPLVSFLNTFEVNGIIINLPYIYEVTIDDFVNKISTFVTNIKKKVNKLIVGLIIAGSSYKYFTNNTLFDFTITNKVLDLYIIVWSQLNICDEDTVKCGLSPITSNIPDMITLEQVNSGVNNSSMDKSKIYARMQIYPIIPKKLLSKDATYPITTYSIYCSSTDQANSSQWCINPSKLSYDQGAYAKKSYAGIVLEQLDTDDYEGCCECEQFPVSNQIIDGWTASPFKACPKLDHN